MSDVDTMRWGDTQTLNIGVAGGETSVVQSSQMLNAHWQRPCVWRLMLSVAPAIPTGETVDFDVVALVRVGVGQANQLVPLATLTFTNAAGYPAQTLFFDVPAQDIQVQFTVSVHGGGVPTNQKGDAFVVSAFVAPHSEPAAIAQMRDAVGGNPHRIQEPDHEGHPRWMPPGFDDGQLRYR
jgi:hypothetical protein